MFDKFIDAITPFALVLVVLAGATLTGWVEFSNKYAVGFATVVAGILLIVTHIVNKVKTTK